MNTDYTTLLHEIESFTATGGERGEILLKTCELLKKRVFHYDWVGFYVADATGTMLILDSYCGKPTEHTAIPFGKGVCGQVAEHKKLKIVQDVSQESNYISCSMDVQSEIVVPVLKAGHFVAEIDIDSHSPAPFTTADEEFLTEVCERLSVLF